MIQESRYWKKPLLRAATWLEKLRINEESAKRSLVRVEKELFIGFYSIRKLLETFKVSDSSKALSFELKWSPCVKPIDYFNAHRIDELFDLNEVGIEIRDIWFLCNQFIHSYIFVPIVGEQSELFGFYVSSDRVRHKKVFLVELHQVLSAFRAIGHDYPERLVFDRNPRTGQWEGIVQ